MRAIGVMDAAGRFHEADAVCLVTGPWTGPLLAPVGVQIPITPERAQIAFFRRAPTLRHLTYIDTISGPYFRPHGADLTLAGLASFPKCAACFSQIQEREARRAPTPRRGPALLYLLRSELAPQDKMETQAVKLLPNENPDLREEVKTLLPNGAAWLETQNFLFDGRKPNDLIGTPEEFRVRDVIRAVKHGFIS